MSLLRFVYPFRLLMGVWMFLLSGYCEWCYSEHWYTSTSFTPYFHFLWSCTQKWNCWNCVIFWGTTLRNFGFRQTMFEVVESLQLGLKCQWKQLQVEISIQGTWQTNFIAEEEGEWTSWEQGKKRVRAKDCIFGE